MLPLHLGVARITALVPRASWIALFTVIPLVAVIALGPFAALIALITVISGLRLGQPQGCAGNARQSDPADGSCDGVHGIPFFCHKRALR